eukprot:s569_g11.t1
MSCACKSIVILCFMFFEEFLCRHELREGATPRKEDGQSQSVRSLSCTVYSGILLEDQAGLLRISWWLNPKYRQLCHRLGLDSDSEDEVQEVTAAA